MFVDVYPTPEGPSNDEVLEQIKDIVPASMLKAVVIRPATKHTLGPLDTVQLNQEYGQDTSMIPQFSRLSRPLPPSTRIRDSHGPKDIGSWHV